MLPRISILAKRTQRSIFRESGSHRAGPWNRVIAEHTALRLRPLPDLGSGPAEDRRQNLARGLLTPLSRRDSVNWARNPSDIDRALETAEQASSTAHRAPGVPMRIYPAHRPWEVATEVPLANATARP